MSVLALGLLVIPFDLLKHGCGIDLYLFHGIDQMIVVLY